MFPLLVKGKPHLFDKKGLMYNKELFKAICNGYEVEFVGNKDEKGDEDIIDI